MAREFNHHNFTVSQLSRWRNEMLDIIIDHFDNKVPQPEVLLAGYRRHIGEPEFELVTYGHHDRRRYRLMTSLVYYAPREEHQITSWNHLKLVLPDAINNRRQQRGLEPILPDKYQPFDSVPLFKQRIIIQRYWRLRKKYTHDESRALVEIELKALLDTLPNFVWDNDGRPADLATVEERSEDQSDDDDILAAGYADLGDLAHGLLWKSEIGRLEARYQYGYTEPEDHWNRGFRKLRRLVKRSTGIAFKLKEFPQVLNKLAKSGRRCCTPGCPDAKDDSGFLALFYLPDAQSLAKWWRYPDQFIVPAGLNWTDVVGIQCPLHYTIDDWRIRTGFQTMAYMELEREAQYAFHETLATEIAHFFPCWAGCYDYKIPGVAGYPDPLRVHPGVCHACHSDRQRARKNLEIKSEGWKRIGMGNQQWRAEMEVTYEKSQRKPCHQCKRGTIEECDIRSTRPFGFVDNNSRLVCHDCFHSLRGAQASGRWYPPVSANDMEHLAKLITTTESESPWSKIVEFLKERCWFQHPIYGPLGWAIQDVWEIYTSFGARLNPAGPFPGPDEDRNNQHGHVYPLMVDASSTWGTVNGDITLSGMEGEEKQKRPGQNGSPMMTLQNEEEVRYHESSSSEESEDEPAETLPTPECEALGCGDKRKREDEEVDRSDKRLKSELDHPIHQSYGGAEPARAPSYGTLPQQHSLLIDQLQQYHETHSAGGPSRPTVTAQVNHWLAQNRIRTGRAAPSSYDNDAAGPSSRLDPSSTPFGFDGDQVPL